VIDYTLYDDQALWRAITQPEGDRAAYTVFYKRHVGQLYTNLLTFAKDPLEAEEAVQEVFARIWQMRTQLVIATNIVGYLNKACRNKVIDNFRKVKKDKYLLEKLKETAKDDNGESSVDKEKLVQEQWDLLQKALDILPPKRREVFELCKINGMSYPEACAQLGISLPTLKEHIMKAKRSIQEHLSSKGEVAVTLLILLNMMDA
jgi:RNA polymerase sigma factor (sigma-70 family)